MRKFYRTLITLEILSEYEPVPEDLSLQSLGQEIDYGDWSGIVKQHNYEELTPQQMATYTIEQGSDPEFFALDAKGNDLLEEERKSDLSLTVDHGHVYADGDAKDGK